MLHRPLLISLMILAGTAHALRADACSCAQPTASLLFPKSGAETPRNVRIRIESPKLAHARFVLRSGNQKDVPLRIRESELGWITQYELAPTAPLKPNTQYEVGIVYEKKRPPTTVLGWFRTNSEIQQTPPAKLKVKKATVYRNPNAMGSMCGVRTPFAKIIVSSPKKTGGALYGVWLAKAGKLNLKTIPTAVFKGRPGDKLDSPWSITLGKRSLCAPLAFPLPRRGTAMVGIAAIDAAGNPGPLTRLQLNVDRTKIPSW